MAMRFRKRDAFGQLARKREQARLPPWTTFETAFYPEPTEEDVKQYMALYGASREHALKSLEVRCRSEVFLNSRYQVVREEIPASEYCEALIHLYIRRLDWEPAGPERYRDFMRIRDELVGYEHDAVELYPRRLNEIDEANLYHLWVSASERFQFPFGLRGGRSVLRVAKPGTKQRPFDPDDFEIVRDEY